MFIVHLRIRRSELAVIFLALLSSLACEPNATESEGPPLPTKIPARVVRISLVGDSYYAGDTYLFAAAYTKSGGRAAGFSADWRDVVLDLSPLGDKECAPLGLQNDSGGKYLAMVCRRDTHARLVIDEAGLVFPLGATRMEVGGPFLRLTLHDSENNKIDPHSLKIQVLSSTDKQHHYWISPDKLVIISGLASEAPLNLNLSDSAGKNLMLEIFPYVRGAMHDVVNYDVDEINIGTAIPGSK